MMALSDTPRLTNHATTRAAQRNLSAHDLATVWMYGVLEYHTGVMVIFLGRRQLAEMPDGGRRYGHLEGTTMLIGDAQIITCYRNRRDGLKEMRHKEGYNRHTRRPLWAAA